MLRQLDAKGGSAREFAVESVDLRHYPLPDVMIAARRTDAADTSIFAALQPKLDLLVDDLLRWSATLAAGRAAG